jgi:hypothetical protein
VTPAAPKSLLFTTGEFSVGAGTQIQLVSKANSEHRETASARAEEEESSPRRSQGHDPHSPWHTWANFFGSDEGAFLVLFSMDRT